MKYDIIIPSWNQKKLTIDCLNSIKRYSSDYRMIFVDNASEPSELAEITEVLTTMPHTLIQNTENLGFVKATNQGLCMATAPYVVMMNNDTEAAEGWLEALAEPLQEPQIMLSGPRTTTPKSWQGKYAAFDGWMMLKTTTMIAFFCCMAKREIFDVVGFLDEDFGPGFGDDDHYCWKVHQAGYRIALVGDLVIPHHHRSTFNQIYGEQQVAVMQSNSMKLFEEKTEVRPKPVEVKPVEVKPVKQKERKPEVRKPQSSPHPNPIPLNKIALAKLIESGRPKVIRRGKIR